MSIYEKYYTKQNRNNRIIIVLFLLLFLLILLSISLGSINISLHDIIDVFKSADYNLKYYNIIHHIRIPRTIAAIISGFALSLAGFIIQVVLNNSLASPNIIGINAGAGFGVLFVTAFVPEMFALLPIASFLGAMIVTLSVYFIAKKTNASRMSIVLSGIALSSIMTAMSDTILILFPDTGLTRISFLIGGFSGVGMRQLYFPIASIVCIFIIVLIKGYDLNILSLGEEIAMSLGVNVSHVRLFFLFSVALLCANVVSFAGVLGFVGLIVPHTARFFIKDNSRILIIVTALMGSIFTLFCDILARVLFAPFELPVGIIMSFLGAPFFLYLLLIKKRGMLK